MADSEIKCILFFSCLGLSKDNIQLCVNWMAPFVESVNWFGKATLRDFSRINKEDRHNVQTHTDYMTMLVSIFFSPTCRPKVIKMCKCTPPKQTTVCDWLLGKGKVIWLILKCSIF